METQRQLYKMLWMLHQLIFVQIFFLINCCVLCWQLPHMGGMEHLQPSLYSCPSSQGGDVLHKVELYCLTDWTYLMCLPNKCIKEGLCLYLNTSKKSKQDFSVSPEGGLTSLTDFSYCWDSLKIVDLWMWFEDNSASMRSSCESFWLYTQVQEETLALCLGIEALMTPNASQHCEIWVHVNTFSDSIPLRLAELLETGRIWNITVAPSMV